MKLGGNRPPGDNPLLFSISGTGSFICPVAQTPLDIPRPLITQSWGTGGKPKCSVPQVGLELTTHRLTVCPYNSNGSRIVSSITYHFLSEKIVPMAIESFHQLHTISCPKKSSLVITHFDLFNTVLHQRLASCGTIIGCSTELFFKQQFCKNA